jgi:hypothetical protein
MIPPSAEARASTPLPDWQFFRKLLPPHLLNDLDPRRLRRSTPPGSLPGFWSTNACTATPPSPTPSANSPCTFPRKPCQTANAPATTPFPLTPAPLVRHAPSCIAAFCTGLPTLSSTPSSIPTPPPGRVAGLSWWMARPSNSLRHRACAWPSRPQPAWLVALAYFALGRSPRTG